jgi:hypothetical protein
MMMGHSSPSFLHLVARQVVGNATANTDGGGGKPTCGGGGVGSEVDFNMGLHIGALFIILTTSAFGILTLSRVLTTGSIFPILSKRVPALKIPNSVFLVAKFFGTGVIIATAFIHVPPFFMSANVDAAQRIRSTL